MTKEKVQGKIVSFNFEEDDSRFVKCKLKLMHDGQSRNKTQFSKEVMIDCVEKTIRNTPILCHVYKDEDNNYRIGNHDIDYSIEKNDKNEYELNIKHLEKPVGFIPESTEIFTEEENGRTYIYAYGLLWKHYMDKLNDLLVNQDCESNISTELRCLDADMNEDDILDIKSFEMLGTTIISSETGMIGSKGEFYFSKEDEISIEDMQKAYELEQKGGEDENMDKDKQVNQEPQVEETIEDVVETYSLTDGDIRSQIEDTLNGLLVNAVDCWGEEYQRKQYWLYSFIPDDKVAILMDCTGETCTFVGVPYDVEGDVVKLNLEDKKPYISEWRPMNTGEAVTEFSYQTELDEHLIKKYNNLNEEFNNLEKEINGLNEKLENMKDYEELKEFKLQSDKVKYEKEVEKVTKKFGLDEEEISELKEKVLAYELDIKGYEKELAYLFAMKKLAEKETQNYNLEQPKGEVEEMPQIDDTTDNEPYGGLFNLIK